MIASLYGLVAGSFSDGIVLEVGPVTLEIQMPQVQAAQLRQGDEVRIYTHLQVSTSTDQLKLYGFDSLEGKRLFSTLIKGSGVGPKVALALLDLGIPGLVSAVMAGDEGVLCSVPGVGPKLAKKIILELKDKVTKGFAGAAEHAQDGVAEGLGDAVQAVVSLGFSRIQAERAVFEASKEAKGLDIAGLIKLALAKVRKG